MNMYTLPAWRGRGVATTLLTHVISYVRTTPCDRIWLHATAQGRPLYEKAGFAATHEEMEMLLSASH
jgi:GNAT superfamily N-acetyltransferase